MDRREAKDMLSGYRLLLAEETDLRHALDLAIEALEQTESEKSCDTCKHRKLYECGDCRFASKWDQMETQGERMTRTVHELSGWDQGDAESTTTTDCISRQQAIEVISNCKGICDCYDDVRTLIDNIPPVTPTVNEDCISREWVLNLYKEWQPTLATNVYEFGDALKNAPSVTPTEAIR